MNILLLAAEFPPFFVGGIALHTYETCKYLSQNGYNVWIVTFQQDKEETCFELIDDKGLHIYRVPRPNDVEENYQFSFLKQNVQIKLGIMNLKKEYNLEFDLIVIHGYFLGEAALYAKDLYKSKLIYHAHTDYDLLMTLEERSGQPISPSYLCERLLCNESITIIAVSQYLKKLLVSNFGNEEKIIIIPKGVNLEEYTSKENKIKEKKHQDLNLIFVGRLSEDKGIEVLLNAIPILKNNIDTNIKVYIVGTAINQEYFIKLLKLSKKLSIEKNLLFLGYKNQDELIKIYSECDISIVPSYSETFGKIVIEAMAAKLPVIVSDVSGLGEIVQNEINGLKFDSGDYRKLAKAIIQLYKDEDLRKIIIKSGLELVKVNYQIDNILSKTSSIYYEAITAKSIE